jgi:phage/plasmid-like protein (TIGR03299 family)
MSTETLEHLNTQTLIGFAAERGNAWHYRKGLQSGEPNHYPGAIPIADVRRRLLGWEALEARIVFEYVNPITGEIVERVHSPEHKGVGRSDTFAPLGVFKAGYEMHQYDEWLLQKVAHLLDDDLQIGSAGLLEGGGMCWVSIEAPKTLVTPSGVEFRPHLVAATSHNGRLATTYQRCVQVVVCDNTLAAALSEGKPGERQRVKVRHSRYSHLKLQDAREALGIVFTIADDFTAHVEKLTNIRVTDEALEAFLAAYAPTVDKSGNEKGKRGITIATNKRNALREMYASDERITPWAGTAFGVLQLINTFEHHGKNVRGERGERNMLRAVTGEFDRLDSSTIATLTEVLDGTREGQLIELAA